MFKGIEITKKLMNSAFSWPTIRSKEVETEICLLAMNLKINFTSTQIPK